MPNKRHVKISKYLAKYLRHKPNDIGINLADGGWVKVNRLLKACEEYNFPITPQELQEIVINNDKQRFSCDITKTLIRANQGHSVKINLQLIPAQPSDILYHGTAAHYLTSIMEKGLCNMSCHHVHVSVNIETAKKVGQRYGEPVILAIDTPSMNTDGHQFFCSGNGVWLVDFVPPQYLNNIYPKTI